MDEPYFLACWMDGKMIPYPQLRKLWSLVLVAASILVELTGHVLGFSSREEVTNTPIENTTLTKAETETKLTTTEIRYLTTGKTGTLLINIGVEKPYNPNTKDYEAEIKEISPELDNLKTYCKNSVVEKALDKNGLILGEIRMSTVFLLAGDIGEQSVEPPFEKDGTSPKKDFSMDIELRVIFPTNTSRACWKDALIGETVNSYPEELFKQEYELARCAGTNKTAEQLLYIKFCGYLPFKKNGCYVNA
jgi:hypothetical protein